MRELSSLVDLASDAALVIDGDSHIVAWNERAVGLLGYSAGEALDRPCCDVLQANLPDGMQLCSPECEGRRCFDRRLAFGVADCYLRHKDGRWLRAMISTLVAPARSGRRAGSSTLAIILLRPYEEVPTSAVSDGRLRVVTLGHFELSANGRDVPISRWYRRQALTLLKILVTNRRQVLHREVLIAHLWPDADERRGRERLKVTTYFLREQLRAAGLSGDIVEVTGSGYMLRFESIWLDCEVFERFYEAGRRLTHRGRRAEAFVSFENAGRLYRGDFLPEDLYAEWCAEERERLRETYFDVIGHIVDGYLDRGEYEDAIAVCRRGLVHEPCREGLHRALMICLACLGQRDRLNAHYEHCRRQLKETLGVEPAPETERLYRELLTGGGARIPNGRSRV